MKALLGLLSALLLVGGAFVLGQRNAESPVVAEAPSAEAIPSSPETVLPLEKASARPPAETAAPAPSPITPQKPIVATGPRAYTHAELLELAGPLPSSFPLGDKKYATDKAKKGSLYLCRARSGQGGGAQGVGSWIRNGSWYPGEKISVQGQVSWPNAAFDAVLSGAKRLIAGNGLPDHHTGVYPVSSSDPAYAIDRNPNSIKPQDYSLSIAAAPAYKDTPSCLGGGGPIGYMLSGVALYDAFDELARDAVAYEVQDSCDGHPQQAGQYHYHGPSRCAKDTSVSTVLGYALDGFPITGNVVAPGKHLLTEDLDECHGIASDVVLDGKTVSTYHYVLTPDFPYSISCFRGTPAQSSQPQQAGGGTQPTAPPPQGAPQGGGKPPQEAIAACTGKAANAACSVQTPNGALQGTCRTTPDGSFACVP